MGQISAGPSGVFGAKGPGDSRLYYLSASRRIVNPSEELLDDSDWIQVITKNSSLHLISTKIRINTKKYT